MDRTFTLVQSIACNSYIGQTGRKLSQRLDEHRCVVRQADFNSSALAEHVTTNCEQRKPLQWPTNETIILICTAVLGGTFCNEKVVVAEFTNAVLIQSLKARLG